METYIIPTTVISVTERFRNLPSVSDGKGNWAIPRESLGWFILFEGSRECLFLGSEKPAIEAGQKVTITIACQD